MRNTTARLAVAIGVLFVSACSGGPGSLMPSGPSGAPPAQTDAFVSASQRGFTAQAPERVLYSFAGGSDGDEPFSNVTNIDGVLYGTTSMGGTSGAGTVFAITTTGSETVLHAFAGGTADGGDPTGNLTSIDGVLYGTTAQGGASGFGTVYKITTSGAESVLYSFKGGKTDGETPLSGLIAVNGTLYGTTVSGGPANYGTVYAITPSGTERVLHAFGTGSDSTDGTDPYPGLTDVDGVLYGTTRTGGENGDGAVYKITTSGAERVIYSFPNDPGHAAFLGNLTNVGGELYGTSRFGGTFRYGFIFKVTTAGVEKTLHSFGGGNDGRYPSAGSLTNVNGVLYGTTENGGIDYNGGTVYKITTSGVKSAVYDFARGADAAEPNGGLVELNGVLYGTSFSGGAEKDGAMYAIAL